MLKSLLLLFLFFITFYEQKNTQIINIRDCKIKHFDSSTIKQINDNYWKDKNNIYWDNKIGCDFDILDDVDLKTFTALSNAFGKDNKSVYAGSRKLKNADTTSFEIINVANIDFGLCAKDKNRKYASPYLHEDTKGNSIDEKCNIEN